MNKTQWHFPPKIHIFIVSCDANIHSSVLVKTKTLPDNLHSAACKQSDSRVDPNARSLDSERSERAPIDRSVCLRTRERLLWLATEWVNERISDSSECSESDVSELVFERALDLRVFQVASNPTWPPAAILEISNDNLWSGSSDKLSVWLQGRPMVFRVGKSNGAISVTTKCKMVAMIWYDKRYWQEPRDVAFFCTLLWPLFLSRHTGGRVDVSPRMGLIFIRPRHRTNGRPYVIDI